MGVTIGLRHKQIGHSSGRLETRLAPTGACKPAPWRFCTSLLDRVPAEVQAYLDNIAGSLPDHRNKVSIAIKQVIISFRF